MRILIQVRGGAVRSVAVEADTGPVRVMLWDHDNIEAGEGFDEADDFPHDILEPGDFDDLLAGGCERGGETRTQTRRHPLLTTPPRAFPPPGRRRWLCPTPLLPRRRPSSIFAQDERIVARLPRLPTTMTHRSNHAPSTPQMVVSAVACFNNYLSFSRLSLKNDDKLLP